MVWRYDRSKNKKKRALMPIFAIAGIMVLLVAGVIGYKFAHSVKTSEPSQPVAATAKQPKIATPSVDQIQGRYLLNGTVTWARAVETEAHGDFTQPFSQLNTFNRDQYDAWSTDFECPITNNVVPYQEQVTNLVFNCRPEFLPASSKYFNIYDLANNHTDNQGGEVGLAETRQHLEAAGVQYFGTFDSADASHVCEVLALPVRLEKSDKTEQKASLPVAFCGWHYTYRTPKPNEIAVMDKYAKIMPVFAFVEMGVEYHPNADATQQTIAHEIIDHNPAFLIANNPHWVQNTEVYKNKLIVYSTGNFIFDQLDTETQRSGSVDLKLSTNYDANVAKWTALAPICAKFQDDCLAQAEKQGLSKVDLSLQYGVVAGQNGYKMLTHKADATTQAAVLQRMNWTQTCQQLPAGSCQ